MLNGNLAIEQHNKTIESKYVASTEITKLSVNMNRGDFDYINKTATNITTYWYIDCKLVNVTKEFQLNTKFNGSDSAHSIAALVKVSFDPPPVITTTAPPITTTTPIPKNNNNNTLRTISNSTSSASLPPITTKQMESVPSLKLNSTSNICDAVANPEPNTTYGLFFREIESRGRYNFFDNHQLIKKRH